MCHFFKNVCEDFCTVLFPYGFEFLFQIKMMPESESEQFSLRWNNFHSNLTSGFHALLQGEDLVDVTLAAGGQFVQAHKIVLSVCSPYFKELFKVFPLIRTALSES